MGREGKRRKEEGERKTASLQRTQEETPIGGLQTPKVAIIAERGAPHLLLHCFIYCSLTLITNA